MNGWIKQFRSELDWEWFTDVPTAHLWQYMKMKANWFDETWRGVFVPRGSFVTSDSKMAIETGLSRQQIRTAVKKLLSTNNITKTTTKEYTIITVINYDSYQGEMDDCNQQTTTVATTTATTNEEDKKKRRKEYIYNTRFVKPTLEEVAEYISSRNTNVDANRFWNYYESNGWKVGKNPMKDWKACVRTWERNSKDTPREEDHKVVYPSMQAELEALAREEEWNS